MGTNITGIGNANAIGFKSRVTGGIYLPPELKDALVGVWSAYGKSNDSTDRNIIKNKIKDRGGDFVISNAAFKLNSGFGKYEVDFTSWIQTNGVIASSDKVQNSIIGRFLYFNTVNKKEDIPSFKVNITLGQQGKLQYNYIKEDGTSTYIVYSESGIYTIPASYFSKYTGGNAWFGFYQIEGTSIIEQIPSFEGAFVTDGIDDLITSTKTVQEMLGGSTEFTAVSMIHLISPGQDVGGVAYTNYIRTSDNYWTTNRVSNTDKTGIYGYSFKQGTPTVINNVLGDKNDYTTEKSDITSDGSVSDLFRANFSVEGFEHVINGAVHTSSVAWYWTIIANKVLTTDEINQVIAYYNLDRTLRPDILCNITKQGITNDNHADFNDKLIDYSGNGRDIQMYNLAWKGGSGIAAKPFETIKDYTILSDEARQKLTIYNEFSYKVKSNTPNHYWIVQSIIKDNTSYQVTIITDKDCYWINSTSFINNEGNKESIRKEYPVKANTPTQVTICGLNEFEYPEDIEPTTAVSYVNLNYAGEVTVTFIPSCKGGLLLDGINDFGKVTGMPIYKDYTVIADYIRISAKENVQDAPILSKSKEGGDGAFIFNYVDYSTSKTLAYSFANINNVSYINDFERNIYYQSKYTNNGNSINAGTGVDTNSMWLGTYRDNVQNYFTGAIYSLMSFPYSMSKFLIERQLKKHKLGTLYPDMVEFRPVIKKDNRIKNVKYYKLNETADYIDLNIGDYIPVGQRIAIVVDLEELYEITSITSSSLTDVEIRKAGGQNYAYDILGYVTDKSPQKITMDIQIDTNLIQWNPIITSTAELTTAPTFAIRGTSTLLKAGDWIPKNSEIWVIVTMNNLIDELRKFSFNGTFIHIPSSSYNPDTGKYGFPFVIDNESPQNINITIDEYIRFEDIIQPYPAIVTLKQDGKDITWGDKLKVGSEVLFANKINLLPDLYQLSLGGAIAYNETIVYGNSPIKVEKSMVFKNSRTYLKSNEPKCILSPSKLRIPNSSYKILGYIPDISGHGNHGKINNSAYAGMSGANGYLLDFKTFTTGNSSLVNIKDDSRIEVININKEKSATFVNLNKSTSISLSSWKIKVTGMKSGDTLGYYYSESTDATLRSKFDIKSDGIYSLPSSIANSNNIGGIAFDVVAGADSAYRIEQIGEYEGAYCLDGVDDFVTIPTTVGGKQVLMKVNSRKSNCYLYDQRNNWTQYLGIVSTKDFIAYNYSNQRGKTYIDGILNENITANDLIGITHNITVTNNRDDVKQYSPCIGTSFARNSYAQMSLYDFMLFDDISTDDKIKELNEYVGIEAKVELPPYYWDAYGKTNLDGDKATIQQRGVAVGDYDLTNNNLAYEGMSGYNGYPVVFGENKTWVNLGEYYVWTVSATKFNITQLCFTKALQFSYIKANGSIITANNKDIAPFRIKVTGIEPDKFSLRYIYLSTANATLESTITINSDGIYELPKSFASDGSLTSSDRWVGFSFIKRNTELADVIDGVNVTIEVLPEYENGLVYDGITNYSKNANIPALDDFTAIIKREWLKKQGSPLIKGSKVYEGGNGNALLLEWDEAYNFVFYKRTDIMEGELPDNISFITPTNYNGNVITRGSEQDTNGICIAGDGNAGFANMVFYKLILYPKTIPLLQINFLKNLMERDEIIDLTNPIFIKNE